MPMLTANPSLVIHLLLVAVSMFLRRKQSQNPQEIDSEERDRKVNELRAALGPLSGRSLKFCTDACLRRYLEARSWNVVKAKKLLEETLKWRAIYKPEEIRWHEVAHEGETGKVSRANFHDLHGRTVLIMRPGKQNTSPGEGNVRHLVYLLENAILNLAEGQDHLTWLIDFTGWTINTNISIKIIREIIYVFQNHYPERLAIAILYNPPKFFESIWKAIRYFLDPKTSEKLKFIYTRNEESVEFMKSLFDVENLPQEFGGKATMEYDHEEFSRLMAQDDVRTAKFWGFDEEKKPCPNTNGHSEGGKAPVPTLLAPPAS